MGGQKGPIKDDEWVGENLKYFAKIEQGICMIVARLRDEGGMKFHERWSWQDEKWVDGTEVFREMSGVGGDGYDW